MIWTLPRGIDAALVTAFVDARQPDQRVITAYLAQSRRPQSPMKYVGVRRYYYLHKDNPRIRLSTVGMPLDDFRGGVKITVGTEMIIGEFPGNRSVVGLKGLKLQCQPLAWLQGSADQEFASGAELLAEISEQVLDDRAIQRSQRAIKKIYRWEK